METMEPAAAPTGANRRSGTRHRTKSKERWSSASRQAPQNVRDVSTGSPSSKRMRDRPDEELSGELTAEEGRAQRSLFDRMWCESPSFVRLVMSTGRRSRGRVRTPLLGGSAGFSSLGT
mmetsp:Transcript_21785/g.60626  ORF Transcript_21785/g.60626 Transcript_21785/m.60626 type:complete len:119 (-) Transcript_21785:1118-1474(-)